MTHAPDIGGLDPITQPRRNRGRPPDPTKRAAILAATRSLLYTGGPRRLNIETIARTARVSKVTVYAHFGDLQGLMRALILEQRSRMTAALEQLPSDPSELRQVLIDFGLCLMAFLTSDEYLGLQRMLAAQASQQPWLAPMLYAEGAEGVRDKLADLLAHAAQCGDLAPHDSRQAAEQLLGMWQGIQNTGLLISGCPPPPAEVLRTRIECAVELILRAYAPASP